jgi:acetyl esterase/lipase
MTTNDDGSLKLISTDEYVGYPEVPPDYSYAYGDHALQFGDLYLPPSNGFHPVMIAIHGGCWREQYGLKPLGALCRAFADEGFAVWSLEYRRNGNGGGYPMTFRDVAQGADYLRRIADDHDLDLSQVTTIGHSAGGLLALWLAGRSRLTETSDLFMYDSLPIHGVVSLAGIVDLIGGEAQNMCGDAQLLMMGGTVDAVPDRYQQASPMELLPLSVRQLHLIGERDTEILDNVRPYIAAAQTAGDMVELVTIPDAGHFEIVTPTTPAWRKVRETALNFVFSV